MPGDEAAEWRNRAKCRGENPELFFPERDITTYRFVAAQAKAICLGRDGRPRCVVLDECLNDAIEKDELFGIRGALSHRERNALIRKQTRMRA